MYEKGRTMVLQVWFPGQVVFALLGSLLEKQILRPYLRPTESEALEMETRNLVFNKPSRQSGCTFTFENL